MSEKRKDNRGRFYGRDRVREKTKYISIAMLIFLHLSGYNTISFLHQTAINLQRFLDDYTVLWAVFRLNYMLYIDSYSDM